MAISRMESDLQLIGTLTPTHINYPAGEMTNAGIASTAEVEAEKLEHEHVKSYSQPNTTATSVTQQIHTARGAGSVVDFVAGSIGVCTTGATVTVDLRKNGSTVLTGVIQLDHTNTARVAEVGSITGGAVTYVSGDVFEIVTVATAGGATLATGLFCDARFHETSVL